MKRNGIEEQYVIDDFTSKDTWRIFRIIAEFVEGFEMLAKIPPAVAIFGSARSLPGSIEYERAHAIASLLGKNGYSVITGGGPGSSTTFLSLDLVKTALGQFDLGPAAAMSIIYFLIILALSWVFYAVMTREDAPSPTDKEGAS